MTCREMAEFLDRYLGDELPEEERVEFERHLAMCEPCVHYLDTYRQTVDLCRGAYLRDREEGLPEAPEELIRAILAARRRGTERGD